MIDARQVPLLLLTFPAACGGGEIGVGALPVVPPDSSHLLATVGTYATAPADGATLMNAYAISDTPGEGVSGFVADRDGTLRAYRFRVSSDLATLYLATDGGPEVVFDTREFGNASYGRWKNATDAVFVNFSGTDSGGTTGYDVVDYATVSGGHHGLATPLADLPTGPLRYYGTFAIQSLDGSAWTEGAVNATANFDAGTLSGSISGLLTTEDAPWGGVIYDAALGGFIDGNRGGMTAEIDQDGLSGRFDMAGQFYHDAEEFAGAIAATLNGVGMGGPLQLGTSRD